MYCVIVVKFKNRKTSGYVYYVMVVQVDQVPPMDATSQVKLATAIELIKIAPPASRRVCWDEQAVMAHSAHLRDLRGISEEPLRIDLSAFFSDGRSAIYIEKPVMRQPISE